MSRSGSTTATTTAVTTILMILVMLGTGAAPASARDWSGWLERLLFNPKERTERGADALDVRAPAAAETPPPAGAAGPGAAGPGMPSDAAQAAVPPLDSALRLRGTDDAVAQYNAGTARLAGERPDAVPLLESAARSPDSALAAQAAYNLGNAHLAQADYAAAIDAYKNALRHQPSSVDAKHNLEVARRLLEQQQQQQQDQQNQDQQDQDQDQEEQQDQEQDQEGEGEQDPQDQQDGQQDQQDKQDGQQEQSQDQEQQDPQDGEQDQQDGQQDQQDPSTDPGQQEQQRERPLPNFEDLPDMTAEEAAAIIQAVENLEREARRQAALEAAAQAQASGKKDW